MTRRTRFVAGLLALLALTFSFTESVWASTCAPMGDGEPMETPTGLTVGAESMPSESMPSERGPHEGERRCPFGSPVAAQTCAGVVTLPAQACPLLAPSFEGRLSVFTLEMEADRLPESALFRPPRA